MTTRFFVATVMAFLLVGVARAQDLGMGDVFVAVSTGGGQIFLDGATTGIVAPGVVNGVAPGAHTIRVDDGCLTATTGVTVRPNAVERVTMTLEPGAGTVKVDATPPETVVTDAGAELGRGSFGPVPLACGSHTLVGTATGRQTTTYTVEVPLRGHADVRLDLPVSALGSIAITPAPVDAEVYVDGVDRGAGPMTVDGLAPGSHAIRVEKDGYLPGQQAVTVVAYQIVRSSIVLQPKPPPVPLGTRMGLDRVDWMRVGINLGLSAGAVGLGTMAWLEHATAVENYATYSAMTYADQPDAYYRTEVEGPRTLSIGFAAGAGATALTAGVLWATTHPRAPSTDSGVAPSATPAPGIQLRVTPAPDGLWLTGTF